jgi:hypothetical protein
MIRYAETSALPATSKSLVYFVMNYDTGAVKIGFTTNIKERLSSLRSGAGARLEVLRSIEGGEKRERWLHKRFAHLRREGEWFGFHDDMLTVVPPDEVPDVRRMTVRRDVKLTAREKLRSADAQSADLRLGAKSALLLFGSSLTDEQADHVLSMLRDSV